MGNEKLKTAVLNFMPEAEISEDAQFLEVSIEKDKILALARFLKENAETRFDFLFCETAVDFNEHFMMYYHLDSIEFRHQLVVKAKLEDRENPEIDSVCAVWTGAEYHERELFDLFGIHFRNHPDLRKIFLDNDWVGFPMRKDYSDPVNIVER